MVTDLECLVCEVAGFPDCEAGWVSVPVVVGLCDVSKIVEFFSGVVLVDVLCLSVDCSLEVIATVFNTPEPEGLLDSI